jgi:O-antigen ligase
MMGLGLTSYIVPLLYGLAFLIVFLSAFYRSAIGMLFFAPLLPTYIVVDKILKSNYPFANNFTDMLIFAMLLGCLLQGNREEKQPLEPSPMLMPIFIFMGYSLLSYILGTLYLGTGILSNMAEQRLADWKNYMILPLLYLITYYALRERKWQYALFILLFFSLVAMNANFRSNFSWVKHTHFMYESQLDGTVAFTNANVWGAFQTICSLFLIGLFLIDKHFKRRVAYSILIFSCGYSLIYSYSRGAYVGVLAGLFFIGIVRKRTLLIPLFIFLIMWKSIMPLSVVERVEMTFLEGEGNEVISVGETHIYNGRERLWDESLDYFYKNPIFGSGYKTFGELTGWDTHNEYFKALAEGGIIGFSIFLWLYALALRSGWYLYKNADEEVLKAFGFAFVCAVVGSIVVNFFGDRWSYLQIGGLYWIVWALVDQENSKIKAKGERQEAERQKINQPHTLNP